MNMVIIKNSNMVFIGNHGIEIDCSLLPEDLKEVIWSSGIGGVAIYANHTAEILTDVSSYQSYIDQFNHKFSHMTDDEKIICERTDIMFHAIAGLQYKLDFFNSDEAQEWAAAQAN